MMCIDAADAILLQCEREYGFSNSVAISLRATDLLSLDACQLKGLPLNNLIGERLLAVFDKRASKVAKCKNHKLTGKSIRYVMLYKGLHKKVDDRSRKITKLLNEREKK